MNRWEKELDKYAELAVKVGVNIQPGQTLFVNAPLEAAPLVRKTRQNRVRNRGEACVCRVERRGAYIHQISPRPRGSVFRVSDVAGESDGRTRRTRRCLFIHLRPKS